MFHSLLTVFPHEGPLKAYHVNQIHWVSMDFNGLECVSERHINTIVEAGPGLKGCVDGNGRPCLYLVRERVRNGYSSIAENLVQLHNPMAKGQIKKKRLSCIEHIEVYLLVGLEWECEGPGTPER